MAGLRPLHESREEAEKRESILRQVYAVLPRHFLENGGEQVVQVMVARACRAEVDFELLVQIMKQVGREHLKDNDGEHRQDNGEELLQYNAENDEYELFPTDSDGFRRPRG